MPAFIEKKLQQEYGANSPIVYATMNKLGALRGNKETPKGRAMQAKHDRDVAAGKAAGRARKPGGRLALVMGKA
jgi:hypothetical protein